MTNSSCDEILYNDTCCLAWQRCNNNRNTNYCYAGLGAPIAQRCQPDAVYPFANGTEKIRFIRIF